MNSKSGQYLFQQDGGGFLQCTSDSLIVLLLSVCYCGPGVLRCSEQLFSIIEIYTIRGSDKKDFIHELCVTY